MLTWPSQLPRPSRQGWQRSLQDARFDRSSSAGPVLPRLMHSVRMASVAMVMDLDRRQKAVFDKFVEFETRLGTLPFLMPDPTTDGWPLLTSSGAPLLTSAGQPILLTSKKRCYFGKPLPAETLIPGQFRMSFNIVVLL